MRDDQYGKNSPKFCFAVSFQNENDKYNYSLRFNMTRREIPRSNRDLTLDEALDLASYSTSYV